MWSQLVDAYAQRSAGQGGGGGGGMGWGFSQSGSADSGPLSGDFGSSIGGINTGRQGLDLTTIAVIGGIVLVALFILKR